MNILNTDIEFLQGDENFLKSISEIENKNEIIENDTKFLLNKKEYEILTFNDCQKMFEVSSITKMQAGFFTIPKMGTFLVYYQKNKNKIEKSEEHLLSNTVDLTAYDKEKKLYLANIDGIEKVMKLEDFSKLSFSTTKQANQFKQLIQMCANNNLIPEVELKEGKGWYFDLNNNAKYNFEEFTFSKIKTTTKNEVKNHLLNLFNLANEKEKKLIKLNLAVGINGLLVSLLNLNTSYFFFMFGGKGLGKTTLMQLIHTLLTTDNYMTKDFTSASLRLKANNNLDSCILLDEIGDWIRNDTKNLNDFKDLIKAMANVGTTDRFNKHTIKTYNNANTFIGTTNFDINSKINKSDAESDRYFQYNFTEKLNENIINYIHSEIKNKIEYKASLLKFITEEITNKEEITNLFFEFRKEISNKYTMFSGRKLDILTQLKMSLFLLDKFLNINHDNNVFYDIIENVFLPNEKEHKENEIEQYKSIYINIIKELEAINIDVNSKNDYLFIKDNSLNINFLNIEKNTRFSKLENEVQLFKNYLTIDKENKLIKNEKNKNTNKISINGLRLRFYTIELKDLFEEENIILSENQEEDINLIEDIINKIDKIPNYDKFKLMFSDRKKQVNELYLNNENIDYDFYYLILNEIKQYELDDNLDNSKIFIKNQEELLKHFNIEDLKNNTLSTEEVLNYIEEKTKEYNFTPTEFKNSLEKLQFSCPKYYTFIGEKIYFTIINEIEIKDLF